MADILANKYRPNNFSEVIGQDSVVRILTNSFNSNNLHHAYLLIGKYGTGKTSVGRILAAMENCKQGPTLKPCGKCDNCKAIFSGKSNDVKELDAASNRSIESMRAIKEDLWNYPLNARKKYFIIDEFQSLSPQAAESALKMVEEPPSHVRFVLCTTDTQGILPTILSRCMDLDFRPVPWLDIKLNLEKVVKAEKLDAEEEALKIIAKKSDNSVRNSLKKLEKVVQYCGEEKITADAARTALNEIDDAIFKELVDGVLACKPADCMITINKLTSFVSNSEKIIKGLTDYLDKLMITRTCKDNLGAVGFTDDEAKRYLDQALKTRPLLLARLLELIINTKRATIINLDTPTYLRKWVIDAVVEVTRLKNLEPKEKGTQQQ